MINILPRFLNDHIRKQKNRHKVRNCHQGVQDICNSPYQIQRNNRCNSGNSNVKNTIRNQSFFACKIFHASFAIICPSKNRRICERNNSNHQDHRSKNWNLLKGQSRKYTAICNISHINRRIFHNTGNQNKASHKTYNNCIPKSSGTGNKSLANWISCLGSSCGNWSRAHTRFIGKKSSGNSILHSHHNTASYQTTGSSARCKRHIADRFDSRENKIIINSQNNQTSKHIKECHKRNQLFAYSSD